ncbi:MAG: hypothetical protein EBZ91_11340 [Gammaproteobacteria bacterium]|nr:hypothetical protein [Gammaproteobacteria bacterium]
MILPPGAAWLVLPFISLATRKAYPGMVLRGEALAYGLEARLIPTASGVAMDAFREEKHHNPYLDIPPGTVMLTGRTERDSDTLLYPHAEWVEVILPVRCWVNRVHFNSGTDRVARIG